VQLARQETQELLVLMVCQVWTEKMEPQELMELLAKMELQGQQVNKDQLVRLEQQALQGRLDQQEKQVHQDQLDQQVPKEKMVKTVHKAL